MEKENKLSIRDYQKRAMYTCTESSENISYMLSNLVGEVGEFASKFAKAIRKSDTPAELEMFKSHDGSKVLRETYQFNLTPDLEEALKLELGDVMWQANGLASVIGWNMEDVCQKNLDKLSDRLNRGVIIGNGDDR